MRKECSAGTVIFIEDQGVVKFLLLRNKNSCYWDFPKGKIERGETLKQTAIRETKEESGLDFDFIPGFVDTIKYSFVTKEGQAVSKEVTFFLARAKTMNVVLSHEHTEFQWMTFKDAYQNVTFANSRRLLQRANQLLSFII